MANNIINGLSLKPGWKYTPEETPMGVDQWNSAFSGSSALGDGMDLGSIQSYGDPANPSYWRASRNTGGDNYQTRTFTQNPDGTFSWKGSWNDKTKESGMEQFTNAAMLAAAGIGGMGLAGLGPASGLGSMFGGAGATGGATAGGSGLVAGTGTTGLQAGLGSGLSLAAPTGTGAGFAAGTGAGSIGAGIGSTLGAGAGAASGIGSLFNGGLPKMSTGNSFVDKLLGNVTSNLFGGGSGGISNMGNLGSLFSNYQQYDNNKDLINEIKGIYSPDGAYAKALENKLGRRDAAAGRNSQYGPRLAEMLGMLGDSQAKALSGLGGFMGQQQGGLNGMLGAGQRLLGGFDLGSLFKGGMSGLSDQWALGANAGPQLPEGVSNISDLLDWFN